MIKYIHTEIIHNIKSPREIVPFIIQLLNPRSLVDVGCGIGTWLKIFQDHGVIDFLGVDGNNVDPKLLKISPNKFQSHDLRMPLNLRRQFDLALCLEVAEHLPESSAPVLVDSLIRCADVVLFSAATPGQGGQNHINEQWLSYWSKLFKAHDYVLIDIVRPKFWRNENVDVWYRQNMVFFCKNSYFLNASTESRGATCVDIVHPDLFEFYFRQAQRAALLEEGKAGIRLALGSVWKAMTRKFG